MTNEPNNEELQQETEATTQSIPIQDEIDKYEETVQSYVDAAENAMLAIVSAKEEKDDIAVPIEAMFRLASQFIMTSDTANDPAILGKHMEIRKNLSSEIHRVINHSAESTPGGLLQNDVLMAICYNAFSIIHFSRLESMGAPGTQGEASEDES